MKEREEDAECLLPLSRSGGRIIAVFDLEGVLCTVRELGQLEVFQVDNGWRQTGNYFVRFTVCVHVLFMYTGTYIVSSFHYTDV